MDDNELRLLADRGFGGVPPTELARLTAWCKDWCNASGDARFCVLSDVLRLVDDWWARHEESGGVPLVLVDEIEKKLITHIPGVLAARSPSDGAELARTLRSDVSDLLLHPDEWVARDLASR